MKLHLPKGLRAALVACFAAFAGIGTTLTTASITGGVFAVSMASVAQAANYTATYSANSDQIKATPEGGGDAVAMNSLTAEDTLTLDVTAGYLVAGDGDTYNCNLVINNLILTNGHSGNSATNTKTFNFNGSVSGSGEFKRSNAQPWQRYNFNGDVAGYTGTINIMNQNSTVAFVNGTETARQLNATAINNAGGTVVISGGYTVKSTIDAKNISIEGAGTTTLNAASSATSSMTLAEGASLAVGTSGSLTLAGTSTINGSLTNNGALTLGGTVVLTSAITNNGTLTQSEGLTLDLTGLTFKENAGANSYSATLIEGTNKTLDLSTITVLLEGGSAGKTLSYADGVITYTLAGASRTFSGATLSWQNGVAMDNGNFSDGDLVTFTGTSTVTMAAAVTSSVVTVDAGASVSLSNGGVADNKLNAGSLAVDGTLTLLDDVLHADTRVYEGSTGTIAIDVAEDANIDYSAQLADFTGTLNVEGGRVTISGSKDTPYAAINVADGGQLNMDAATYSGAINLAGNGAQDVSLRDTAMRTGNTTLSGKVTVADGGASVATWGNETGSNTLVLTGELAGAGDFTKKEGGKVYLRGNVTLTGDVYVNGGELGFGSLASINEDKGASHTFNVGDLHVASGALLSFCRGALTATGSNIYMAGGTLRHVDTANTDAVNQFGSLVLEGGTTNQFEYLYKGRYVFNSLTGDGNLVIGKYSVDSHDGASEQHITTISSLSNYTGTISMSDEASGMNHSLIINGASQALAEHQAIVDMAATSTNFTKTGEGSVTFKSTLVNSGALTLQAGTLAVEGGITTDSLSMTGGTLTATSINVLSEVTMNHGGTYSGPALQVNDGACLSYTALAGNMFTVAYSSLADKSLTLSLYALSNMLDSTKTLDLGITGVSSSDLAALKSKLTVGGLDADEWSLSVVGDRAMLTLAAGAEIASDWDTNWGASELNSAPVTVSATASLPCPDSTPTEFAVADNTTYHPDGSTTAAILITGTQSNGDLYVFGGSNSNVDTTARDVELDSWIKMTGGDLYLIAGGNYCNNWGSGGVLNFLGDSHIYITSGKDASGNVTTPVVDYIVGGNFKDGKSPLFEGSSYITVATDSVQGAIVGGNTVAHNATTTFRGDSHIYLYSPQTLTADAGFVSAGNTDAIIGGHMRVANSGGALNFEGNTNILVDLDGYTADANMVKTFIGGSFNAGNTITHTGGTNITIRNASTTTFTKDIIGGSKLTSGVTASINGIATLDISSGTFSGMIIGGHYSAGTATISQGGVDMTLSGGTYNGTVFGGHYDSGTAEALTFTGDINLTVSGGTVLNADLVGGSRIVRDNSQVVYTQKNVLVNLQGGTVGNVYAAGSQDSNSLLTTASTTVSVSSGVTFRENSTVSGGYAGTGTGSTVTGDRTLVLSDASYSNLANVTFKDFSVVNISSANGVVSGASFDVAAGDSLTKTGAGTLQLGSTSIAGTLKVQQGTVSLDGTTLTSTAVLNGGTLSQASTAAASNAGALTLGAAAGDVANLKLGSSIALNSLTLAAGAKMNVQGYGTLASDYTVTLFTGLTAGTVNGIAFDTTDGLVADLATYVSNADAFSGGELILTDSGELVITNQGAGGIWKWDDPNGGTWKGDSTAGWESSGGNQPDGARVVFGDGGVSAGGTTTIAISGPVNPRSVEVTASSGRTYVFTEDGDGTTADGIIGSSSLAKTGAGTLRLEVMNTSTGEMTIDAGTVVFGSTSAAGAWAGAVAVNAGTLDVVNIGSNANAVGAITAADAATVKVASGVTLGQLAGGKLEADTTAGGVTINKADAATFASVKNSGTGTLTFGSDVHVKSLDNGGTVATTNKGITIDAVTTGGSLNTGSGYVNLTNGGTFSGIQGGMLTSGAKVLLTGDSSIQSVGGEYTGVLAVSNGTTNVRTTSEWTKLQSLQLSDSGSALLNLAASVEISGNVIKCSAAPGSSVLSNNAGLVSGWNIRVGTTDEGATAAGDGNVTLVGNLASINGSVDVRGNVDIDKAGTQFGNVSAATYVAIGGTADIAGNLSSGGNVTLGKGGTVGGDLTLGGDGQLALGGTLQVAGAMTGVKTINVADDMLAAIKGGSPLATADSLSVGESFTLAFEDRNSVFSLGLKLGGSCTLISTNTDMGDLTDKLILSAPEVAGVAAVAAGQNSFEYNAVLYTLTQSADGKSIVMTAVLDGIEWGEAGGDGTWVGGSDDWVGGVAPTANDNAAFFGHGSSTVAISGTVDAKKVVINAPADDTQLDTHSYVFEGTRNAVVNATALSVAAGDLTLETVSMGTEADALDSTHVGSKGYVASLTVGSDVSYADAYMAVDYLEEYSSYERYYTRMSGALYTDTMSVESGSTYTNKGLTAVSGALTAGDVVNTGMLKFGAGSQVGAITGEGLVVVQGGNSTIDSLSGVAILKAALSDDAKALGQTAVTVTGDITCAGLMDAGTTTIVSEVRAENGAVLTVGGEVTKARSLKVISGGELHIGSATLVSFLEDGSTLATANVTADAGSKIHLGTLATEDEGDLLSFHAAGAGAEIVVDSLADGEQIKLLLKQGSSITVNGTSAEELRVHSIENLGGTFSTTRNVVLASQTNVGGSVVAASLDLSDATGSIFTSVTTNALTLDLSALWADGTQGQPLMTLTGTDGLVCTNGLTLTLDGLFTDAAKNLTADNSLFGTAGVDDASGLKYTDYTLISGAGLAADFTTTVMGGANLQQAFALAGTYAHVVVDAAGNLVLRVHEDDPREWNSSNKDWAGNSANNGGNVLNVNVNASDISADLLVPTYKMFDSVGKVTIDVDYVLDLVGTEGGRGLSVATDAATGLLISNLNGASNLTIKGDAASADTLDGMDRVTILSNALTTQEDLAFSGKLTLEDVDAIIKSEDGAATKLGEVAMDGAVLTVTTGAAVTTGDIGMTDADLAVNTGATLSSGKVTMDASGLTVDGGAKLTSGDVTATNSDIALNAGATASVGTVSVDGTTLAVGTGSVLTSTGLDATASTLTVAESAQLNTGDVTLADSSLKASAGSTLSTGKVGMEGSTLAMDAATLTSGDITMDDSSLTANSSKITAGDVSLEGSALALNGASSLSADDIALADSGLTVGGNAALTADDVTLSGAKAALSAAAGATVKVDALLGTAGTISGVINVLGTNGNYSGGYDVTNGADIRLANGAAHVLAVSDGLSLSTADGVQSASATLDYSAADAAMDSINVVNTAVTLKNMSSTGEMNTLTVDDGSTMTGGSLSFGVNAADIAKGMSTSAGAPVVIDGGLTITGTTIKVTQTDSGASGVTFDMTKSTTGLTLFTLADGGTLNITKADIELSGSFFDRYINKNTVTVAGGDVKADLITDYYTSVLAKTENGRTGMQMLDVVDLQLNPQANSTKYGDLADIITSLKDFRAKGNVDAADKLAAAVAGSGMASLGMAISGDVERQLKAIRNRTTTMGVDPAVVNEEMPYFNAWINAEGDYRSMDEDSTLAGYTLSSWGGTVGFDMDVTPSFTWGLALTAMYGDFSAEAADQVEGDVNTYYVSAFARAMHNAWVHTFVATLGMSNSELERTVSHNNGRYTTEGEADGMSFGLLYEVARTYALNEDATACWQPVFNVAYRHIEVDGYDETGSDAALRLGDQTLDTLTFGLGARLQAVVGENIYNRTSVLEARALVKLEAGDRESEMDTAFLNSPMAKGTVKSAEMDAFGIELGAGITVPVGIDSGSIFLDGSVELRGSYTSANATLGYRINF